MKDPKLSFVLSLIPIVVLILLLAIDVKLFGEDSSYGSNQIALLTSGAVAAVIAMMSKISWKEEV